MTTVDGGERRRRRDVQALRGYAVGGVILFHAWPAIMPAGWLGVDVFFVISGFLISGIVMRQRAAGRFGFVDFYTRRIRRLAPASLLVLLATVLLAAALLTATAFETFWWQLAGALGFATNVALWRQVNYFNNLAGVAPLLHFWSLAVEEQYYLVLPLALALLPRRRWAAAFAAATLASLAAYLLLYPRSPGLAFYLLPTRAWEIGLGSLVACAGGVAAARLRVAAWPAAILLAALPFVPAGALSPHLLALPACVATAILLAADAEGARVRRWLLPLARVGDLSYSLYLVHWPLLAFTRTILLGQDLPPAAIGAVLGATAVAAWLLYRCVEEPLRRRPVRPRTAWLAWAAASLGIAGLGYATLLYKRATRPPLDLRGVTGLTLPGCTGDATLFDGRCAQSNSPQLLLWGDSFSQALAPALVAGNARGIAEASKGQCAPLLGLAPVDDQAGPLFAAGCLAFNRSVLNYLAATPSIKVVVLSGNYARYALPGTRGLRADGTVPAVVRLADLVRAQRRTTAAIRALGRRVVLVGPPPQAAFDVGQCWERRLSGLPVVGVGADCAITPALRDARSGWVARFLRLAAPGPDGTPVVSIDPALCAAGVCATRVGNTVLYRDGSHLGWSGSRWLGARMNLRARVLRDAR